MSAQLSAQLPLPGEDARAASLALIHHISDDIIAADGWIPFSAYMEQVLYSPHFGYYSGGAIKLGKDGDFTTAPEMCPLFGATLATLFAELLSSRQKPSLASAVLEFGAGSGRLALDFLTAAQQQGVALERYVILELSPQLRAWQQKTLRDAGFGDHVQWLDRLPDRFDGLVLANEVLDAMPVELVMRGEHGWLQRGVGLAQADSGDTDAAQSAISPFVWIDRPAPDVLLAQIQAQIPDSNDLPIGYLTEIHPVACGFMRSLAQMLSAGQASLALLFDYGFPAGEYYLPQRHQGTLMCHYRHRAHAEPFLWPGLQDVTAHVDFTAMALAAQQAGLDVAGYHSQAGFLLTAGITSLLAQYDPADVRRYAPLAASVQQLLSPAEMGELFKVLAIGHNATLPERFDAIDRTHRL